MQTVSADFTTTTSAAFRKLNSKVFISFKKNYDNAIDFFEIGTSLIGGTDILKGVNDVIQEWDKFDYEDVSDRIMSVSYNREVDPPVSAITTAQAEIVLDNNDDIFTPGNTASGFNDFMLPRRPVRIQIGFEKELIPMFIGLTIGLPVIDEKNKTATFRCEDFMSYFINKPLDEAVIYEDMTSDEVIAGLLEDHAGLLPTQHDLDLGTITIPFAYFPKGSTLREGLNQVVSADLGNLFCNENGVITFQNRINWLDNSKVWDFNKDNTLEFKTPGVERIINVAEVFSNVREVQANQKVWELESPIAIPASGSVEIFANFSDDDGDLPITAVDDPVYITSATTSLYTTNENEDGSGATKDAFVSLSSSDLFSTGFKMTFANTDSAIVYLTSIELFGTPAKVIKRIYVREQYDASVGTLDGFDEKLVRIENDMIQDETNAESIAQIIISDRGEHDDQRELLVVGVPQLQVGDVVHYTDENYSDAYYVTRINGTLTKEGGFRQLIELTQRTITTYFRIGISEIEGSDQIGP